jgi:DMSO/TMAO reductase YedYZ heme-binding membrane subunit
MGLATGVIPQLTGTSPWITSRAALGILAAYGAILVHASFSWRRRIGPKTWRKVHYLSFFVFAAALLHGLLAGSDSGAPGTQALYVSSATAVGLLGILPRPSRVRSRARRSSPKEARDDFESDRWRRICALPSGAMAESISSSRRMVGNCGTYATFSNPLARAHVVDQFLLPN